MTRGFQREKLLRHAERLTTDWRSIQGMFQHRKEATVRKIVKSVVAELRSYKGIVKRHSEEEHRKAVASLMAAPIGSEVIESILARDGSKYDTKGVVQQIALYREAGWRIMDQSSVHNLIAHDRIMIRFRKETAEEPN